MRHQHWAVLIFISLLPAGAAAAGDHSTHWAFRTPATVEPPALASPRHAEQVRNPIDQFLLAKLESAGLEPAPPADRSVLVRRAYFDLLGLPPSPERVDQFLHDDSPQAWSKLIDTLLDSPHYGERSG